MKKIINRMKSVIHKTETNDQGTKDAGQNRDLKLPDGMKITSIPQDIDVVENAKAYNMKLKLPDGMNITSIPQDIDVDK